VLRLVSFGTKPAVVADTLIAELEQQHKSRAIPLAIFQPNDPVVIKHGPFAGVDGIYQHLTQMPNGEARAFVLIELLSKSISLAVEPQLLKKSY
jgi:transcriptional antiterminator RfaH